MSKLTPEKIMTLRDLVGDDLTKKLLRGVVQQAPAPRSTPTHPVDQFVAGVIQGKQRGGVVQQAPAPRSTPTHPVDQFIAHVVQGKRRG